MAVKKIGAVNLIKQKKMNELLNSIFLEIFLHNFGGENKGQFCKDIFYINQEYMLVNFYMISGIVKIFFKGLYFNKDQMLTQQKHP